MGYRGRTGLRDGGVVGGVIARVRAASPARGASGAPWVAPFCWAHRDAVVRRTSAPWRTGGRGFRRGRLAPGR
ncbi:hypothetical protein GCM10010341_71190 [Streptomyces noursei]|nr:hypothetical protein GCM10010341_71190 [Streptomyces noursei]